MATNNNKRKINEDPAQSNAKKMKKEEQKIKKEEKTNKKEEKKRNSLDKKDAKDVDSDNPLADSELQKELKAVASQLDSINESASNEVIEIEKKYNKLKAPILEKRDELIKKIPQFWFQCFLRCEELRSVFDEVDFEILKCLNTLKVVDNEDIKSGYKVILGFEQNPFFSNPTLTKEFRFEDQKDENDQNTSVIKSTATTVKWINSEFPNQKPDSFFVVFFSSNTDESKDSAAHFESLAKVIKEDIYETPLQAFTRNPPEEDVYQEEEGGEEAEGAEDELGGEGDAAEGEGAGPDADE